MHQSRFTPLALLLTLLFSCLLTINAQVTDKNLLDYLRSRAALTDADSAGLIDGGSIVKVRPVNDKREVTINGVAAFEAPMTAVMVAFQDAMRQQKGGSIIQLGHFSSPPSLSDLEGLELENAEIEDLKQCRPGACELKLSATMINRFQQEVRWGEGNYASQVNQLFRKLLVEYVQDYLTRGDAALIEYHDQRNVISLRDEQLSLQRETLYLNDFAPELASFLQGFPNSQLAPVESRITWTKLKFGLKPVIIITHLVDYTPRDAKDGSVVSISKQIYANHYFDSSFGLTAAIETINSDRPRTFLLYSNQSRADSLAGSMSRLKRKIVEDEAIENLEQLLLQTHLNLQILQANRTDSPDEVQGGKKGFRVSTVLYIATALLVCLLVAVFASRRFKTAS